MITKIKRPKLLTYRPAFTQLSRLDFGPEVIKQREFEEQMSFGMWHAGNDWKDEEVQISWYKWGAKLRLAITNSNHLKKQRKAHPQVFEYLENDLVQPEELRVKLLQLGYADVNEYH